MLTWTMRSPPPRRGGRENQPTWRLYFYKNLQTNSMSFIVVYGIMDSIQQDETLQTLYSQASTILIDLKATLAKVGGRAVDDHKQERSTLRLPQGTGNLRTQALGLATYRRSTSDGCSIRHASQGGFKQRLTHRPMPPPAGGGSLLGILFKMRGTVGCILRVM